MWQRLLRYRSKEESPLPTTKLYLEDPTPLTANARITAIGETPEGRPTVRLDRTPFHAQGGGQKSDVGTLGGARVLHVAHAEGGEVDHVLDDVGGLVVGGQVSALVDVEWRARNARSHTAGHLIVALLEARYPALQAVNGHHWPGQSRVEFSGTRPEGVDIREQLRADLAAAVAGDLPVTITGSPHVDRGIQIGEHPPVPCGGTHLQSLGQLGDVSIDRVRTKSGKLRVSYTAL